MTTFRIATLTLFAFSLLCSSQAEEFDGVEFPAGSISFADRVVSYQADYGNGAVPTHGDFLNPDKALSVPDYPRGQDLQPGSVSLGSGGRITLEFVDNVLTGSGDESPDLHIFEVGTDVEDTFVEISRNGRKWIPVGEVTGAISSIDIDAHGFTPNDRFRFVRLTDDAQEGQRTGETVGADIDAVGAISTIAKSGSAWWMLIVAILLLLIAVLLLRTVYWKNIEFLRYLWASVFLAIVLLLTWGFAIQLNLTWLILLVVVAAIVQLFSYSLISFVRAESLSRLILICALFGAFLSLFVIIQSLSDCAHFLPFFRPDPGGVR